MTYFRTFTSENFEDRLALFAPRRSRADRLKLLLKIDEALTMFQAQFQPITLDGRNVTAFADAAATIALRLRSDVDAGLGVLITSGINGTPDTMRKTFRMLRRFRREARLVSSALRRALAMPEHQPPVRQGQRTDPRTDDLVRFLCSAWNRATGYYPSLSSVTSEFARVVLTLADDPEWRAAGLPRLTYRQLRDRITSRGPIGPQSRWTREPKVAKKTAATSPTKRPKSRK